LLEDRKLLSTLSISNGTLTYDAASSSASALTISVDLLNTTEVALADPDQNITLGSGTTGWSSINANEVVGPANSFTSTDIAGATTAGQSLTLDYTTGDPLPASGLTFTPAAAIGGAMNALTISPGTGNDSFLSQAYSPTRAGAGTITYSDSAQSSVPVTFSNLTPVTDTVPSPTFIFNAPAGATTVNVVDGPAGTTQINDGGTSAFELINFANKGTATVNVNNAGATTTVDTTTASAALTQLIVNSGAGGDTINVQATPTGVTTTTDTSSSAGSTTAVGLNGLLTSILGPLVVQSTGGANTLTVDDSLETTPKGYTLDNAVITATSLPTTITLSGTGISTLNLDSSGGSTVNLSALAQGGVSTYHFTGGTGLGANTLNVHSGQTALTYSTTGTLGFGAGEPTINYTNFATINVTKPATPPVGTPTIIKGTANQALNNVVVATFTDSDLANVNNGIVASINWGDSTTSAGTITPTGSGTYQVNGSHTYAASGSYSVAVTLTDLGTSGSATVSGTTINVTSNGPLSPVSVASTANIAPVLLPNSVYNFTGVALKGVVQDVATTQDVATFQSTDGNATAADFLATINWGDGTTNAGTITEDASGTFHVSGTHTYTTAGSFTPTVTIKDINGTIDATGSFYQTNLVSSLSSEAAEQDTNLINPWGMAAIQGPTIEPFPTTTDLGVADEGAAVGTQYIPTSSPITQSGTIAIPVGQPTGLVANQYGFDVPSTTTPATFLFSNLGGTIAAWASGGSATTAATVAGATFTGLAQGNVDSGSPVIPYLYATDFSGTTGTHGIDVFDSTYSNVSSTTFAGKFADPNVPAGFEPFDIAFLNGNLFVAYALPSGTGSRTGTGGYIDEFDTGGNLVKTIISDIAGTYLDGPWGLLIAPANFGTYSGDLLVGNFGGASGTTPRGTIVGINLTNDNVIGAISSPGGPIVNAGLWALQTLDSEPGLFVTAGIDSQTQGLLAQISPAAQPTFTVAAAPLTAVGATVRGIEGNSLVSPTTGSTPVLVATFMDTGTPGAASSYTATIDWGDGTTSPAAQVSITSQGTPNGTVYSVFGGHTYAETGTYAINVTITNSSNGAIAVASGQAVIADAALTPSATQPTVITTEDVVLSGVVGSFTDGNPVAPTSDYTYVTINWGDGTPETAGTISQPGGTGTAFLVSGTHTYADAGVNAGIGHYPIVINVHDVDGSTTTIANTANVADVALIVTGKLNPGSDSGASNTDNITNVVQPNFIGNTNQPFATITLYATAGSSVPIPIGRGVADASGAWSITANQALADNAYTITAIAVDSSGHTVSSTTPIVPDLVIDTVGPKVTSLAFERFQGRIVVTYQDLGGVNNAGVGLNMASVIDASNDQLISVHHPRVGEYRFNVISDVPGTTAGTQTVTLSVNGGHYIKGGWYFFTIRSASPENPSGVRDIAGNALDGEFYGYFPSGNNIPGGDFVAQLTAIHHTIYAPSTVIGRSTPVTPPGTREHSVYVRATYNPSKFPRINATASRPQAARQAVKRVRHSEQAVSRPIHRIGGPTVVTSTPRSTQPVAIGALDQALNQLGTPGEHRKS
jgi:uncharacterized protein (TIGR03118 family)